ncbi:ADP-ribosylation factor-like protein 6, partial [Tyrophagus putrescentiae]
MSSLIGKFLTILGLKRREANILVVGLDNSGKSTILNYLKRKEDQVEEVVPTVGFTVERLNGLAARTGGSSAKAGLSLTAFDMSGQGRYRNLWEHYYGNVEGIIFVVDSTDALRLVVARDELEMMLKHQQLQIEAEDGVEVQSSSSASSPKLKTSASNSSLGGSNQQPSQLPSSPPNATFRRPDIPILFFANKMDLKDALPSVKISQMLGLHCFPHKNWHIQASNAITGEGVPDGIEWLVYQISTNKSKNGNSGGGGGGGGGGSRASSGGGNSASSSIPSSASSSSLSTKEAAEEEEESENPRLNPTTTTTSTIASHRISDASLNTVDSTYSATTDSFEKDHLPFSPRPDLITRNSVSVQSEVKCRKTEQNRHQPPL